MMVFHILANLLCDRRSRPQLPTPDRACSPGDAAAHLGHRVVAELTEVHVIDHDLRGGSRRGLQIAEATARGRWPTRSRRGTAVCAHVASR